MAKSNPSTTEDVRQWARSNGYTVADRGRLHLDIVKAYNAGSNKTRGGKSKYVLEVRTPVEAVVPY